MSSSRGKSSSKNGGGGGGIGIPAASRKMVQSVKEIVNNNYPDSEIYSVLKDCNMDPNEAVNRLLSQDPFHVVKSKREKRKENKDTTESTSRVTSSIPSRGSRAGAEWYVVHGGSESTKPAPAYRKESVSHTSNLSSAVGVADRKPNRVSDAESETKKSGPVVIDGYSATLQPSSAYQAAWGGVAGQVSMADIVKMGRPQSKVPSLPNVSHRTTGVSENHNMHFSDDHAKVHEVHQESGDYSSQQLSAKDEWPSIEQPSASSQPAISEPAEHPDPSNMYTDRVDRQPVRDEAQRADDSANEDFSSSLSSRKMHEDNADSASLYDNDLYRYQHQNHIFTHQQVEDVSVSVSSVGAKLQNLSGKDDLSLPSDENGPSVVIPDHLQVQTVDCSHLSFGSFGGGSLSGPFASSAPVEVSSEDAPRSEYYSNETLRNESDSSFFNRTNASSGNYDLPSASQPESLNSAAGYSYESAQQLNAAMNQPQTSPQMQDLAPFSNVTVYTNSLQSANVHPGRESDLSYSPFPITQTMPTKYSNSVSSISGSTISMPEALRTVGFPSAQPTQQQQMLSGTAQPQHVTVHPYSQPNLPLGGPFANMIGYPYMHQNYPYMLQQAFPGNNTYHHQSLAAALPQYKNSGSLPQSSTIPSGYGDFGNTSIPGNLPINAPPAGTNLTYNDAVSSQYKDANHLMSLEQSENSALWLHGAGPGSSTMSAGPANTFYGFQGQTGGYTRQGQQQPSQSYGSLGGVYPHFYNSQAAAISLDQQQQQNLRDGQSRQIWQNNSY